MTEKFKEYLGIAIFLIILWGIFDLIEGDGFWGGIGKQFDAIGKIILFLITGAFFIGVLYIIITLFKKN